MSDSPIKGFGVGFGKSSGGSGDSGSGSGARGGSRDGESTSRGPLRIVLVSALSAGDAWSTRSRVPADPIPVDKMTFEKVMARLAPSLAIDVRDPFEPEAAPLKIDLRFADIKSLRADGIVEQVPVLRALVEARKIVGHIRDGKLRLEDARAQLTRILPRASWAEALASEVSGKKTASGASANASAGAGEKTTASGVPAPPSTSDSLDALFDKVGVKDPDVTAEPPPVAPAGSKPAVSGAFSSLIASVARGGKAPSPPRAVAVVGSAIEKAERAFGRIFVEVLRHPEMRRLERAWRGFKMLVDLADARAGVELDVVVADKADVEGALLALGERNGAEAARSPVDVFVIDHDLDATDADGAALATWARAAEDMHAPLVVNGLPSLLGLGAITEMPKALRALTAKDDPRPETTRATASNEAMRWVTVAMNGPLVRAAYTSSSSRLREISFSENPKDPSSHVFAGASIAIGILCAQSYVRTGWPTSIVGPRDGAVENLPVHELEEGGQTYAIPVEVLASDEVLREAARAGVAVFGCGANHDVAFLLRAPTFHKRGPEAPKTNLGDQLFVGRFASAVQQIAAALPSGVDAAAGAEAAEIALSDLFADAGPAGPELRATIANDRLQLKIRPRRFAGVALEELTLSAPLGA